MFNGYRYCSDRFVFRRKLNQDQYLIEEMDGFYLGYIVDDITTISESQLTSEYVINN